MVYCGKPSAGCAECRHRKTRCDRSTPKCGQCIRARRECPGYRNQLDLMFRNESATVKEKAVKSKETSQAKTKKRDSYQNILRSPSYNGACGRPDDEDDEDDNFASDEISARNTLIKPSQDLIHPIMSARQIQSIFPTLEERSAAVFGTMAPTWFQAFDFVGVLCRSENLEAHLQASINAVGLASLANASLAPEMMAKARWDYVKALRLTNEALRSPTSVKKDSTLFSVMVLSIYEMISGTNEVSLDSWAEHVKGAAALVRLRGPEQFKHPVGQRMFLQVTSNLLLNCIQRTIPMPQHFIELRKEAEKVIDTDSPAWRLSGVLIDFTIFRAKVKDREIVGPRIVINQALELDQRLVDEFEDLPEEWMYEIVYTSENPHLVWNGNYHVYQEYLMSHIWNAMRTSRIMLHEVIRDQLLSDSTALIPHFTTGENANRLGTSTDVMLEMQADILASVPHHTPSLLNRNTSAVFDNSRSYFVLWPLFLAGSMDLATEPIRMWAAARLRDIGESMGIRQAVVISEVLMRRVTLKWDTKPVPQLMTCRKQVQARWAEEKPEDIHQARLPENSSLTYESERA